MAEETTKKKGQLAAAVLAGSALVFSSLAAGAPAVADEEQSASVEAEATQNSTDAPEAPDDENTTSAEQTPDNIAESTGSDQETPDSESEETGDLETPPEDVEESPEPSGTQSKTQAPRNSTALAETFQVSEAALELERTEGEAGDTVSVSGTGFTPETTVALSFVEPSDGGQSIDLHTVDVNAEGEFNTVVTIPDVAPGDYNILATDISAGSSLSSSFTVLESDADELELSLNLRPAAGPGGTITNLSGGGYSENSAVEISMVPQDGSEAIVTDTAQADDEGWITAHQITIPEDAESGLYDVVATDDETGESESAIFNVTDATLVVDPETITEEAFLDTGVTLTVDGLEANEAVEFHFGGPYSMFPGLEGEAQANADGVAEYTVQGSEDPFIGTYEVIVRHSETGADIAYGSFDVTSEEPQVSAFPADPTEDGAVRQGELLYVIGDNVTADNTVTIDFGIDGVDDVEVETDENGSFGTEFDVPYDAELGPKTVTVTDDETGEEGTAEYTVAQADGPWVELSTDQARPGEDITITGEGFSPGSTLAISINPTLAEVTTEDGTFEAEVTIPENLAPGDYTLTVANQDNDEEVVELPFEVLIDPALTIDPERIELDDFIGEPEDGAGVAHIVDGLEPGTEISYAVTGPENVNDFESTATADADGIASFAIHGYDVTNPAVYLGEYNTVVTYEDEEGETATLSGSFTVVDGDDPAGSEDTEDSTDSDATSGSTGPVDVNGSSGLAQTGANGVQLGLLAGGLLLAGAALLAVANRKRLFGRTA